MTNTNQNRKKVIVVLVEGYSDKDAFDSCLNKIANGKNISFSVYHGDLFTDYSKKDKTLDDILIEKINEIAAEDHFQIEDIFMVVQLTDTDGVYAPNTIVKQNLSLNDETSPKYNPNCIEVLDVNKMLETREYKKERLHDAIHKKYISYNLSRIPYEIYYMSCNLECALHNCYDYKTDDEKDDMAIAFSSKYISNINSFMSFMNSLNKSNTMEYLPSWIYIEQGFNSLLPASNFIIFLEKLKNSL